MNDKQKEYIQHFKKSAIHKGYQIYDEVLFSDIFSENIIACTIVYNNEQRYCFVRPHKYQNSWYYIACHNDIIEYHYIEML